MQVSEGFSFYRTSSKFQGLVDLGKYTPKHQETERGDHALVFMFQPFAGQWVQTVGAFLSKGCASGTVLHHLVLECIILLENSGFFVDVVTTDGATWNRKMWKEFGLKDHDNSCVHPCRNSDVIPGSRDDRLYFCSDYSHLHKLFRTFVFNHDEIEVCPSYLVKSFSAFNSSYAIVKFYTYVVNLLQTPFGTVKKEHWEAVLELDGGDKNFGLKIAYKLTKNHLKPLFWQKMNVAMAFQVFTPAINYFSVPLPLKNL